MHTFTMRLLIVLPVLLALHTRAQDDVPPPPPVQEGTMSTEEPVLTIVEQMPQFSGGDQAMITYLATNIHYPQECIEAGVEGKVFIAYVVDLDGSITEVKVLRGVAECPALDREAARVVKTMPNWTPGSQNGKPVRVRMTVPIVFKLT